ncbi:MAG: hypothetical protein GX419_04505 [Bacteroidales bacterium]|nr:hypothetical protein [Bacteroidales bacterium]
MKKFTISYFVIFLAGIFALSSCGGLDKMKKAADQVKYEATPKVLELKGNTVEVSFKATFPAKFFNKKAILEMTPVLVYNNQELPLEKGIVQGEKVEGNNKSIKYVEGGSYSWPSKAASFEYKDDMRVSQVVIRPSVYIAGKEAAKLALPPVKVADGIIATQKLVKIDAKPITMEDKFVRTTSDKYESQILYVINRSDVRPTEVKKPEVIGLGKYIQGTKNDPNKQLKGIEILAYASPDGPMDLNDRLSKARQKSASEYLQKELKKAKISEADKKELWSLMATPEDWEGFKALMEKSDIKDKELVLRVLSMYSDPNVREKEIKNMAKTFEEIAQKILPQLRRSRMIAKVDVVGRSDEEIMSTFQSNPSALSLEELLYAGGKLTNDLATKQAIFEKAVEMFPNCFRAHNNLGCVYLWQNKLDLAQKEFEAAQALKESDQVKSNLGYVALLKGDYATAENLFTSVARNVEVANYGLGIINITKGDYETAVKFLGNTPEFNTALAKALNKDNEGAMAVLNNVKGDEALVAYLKAVLGARMDNSEVVFNNLRVAVAKDPSMKKMAATDMEFGKFLTNDVFKSIVQ